MNGELALTGGVSVQNRSVPALARLAVLAFFAALAVLVLSFAPAHAEGNNSEDQQAKQTLSTEVYSAVSGNEYEVEGGGSLKGSQLLEKDDSGVYQVNKSEYEKLNGKGRDALATDVVAASNDSVENGSKTGVTEETQSNWMKDLQQNPGFGSKILGQTLKQTGPDFVTANRIFQPFSGPISTIMGLGAILIMAFFGLIIVCDIAYIVIPPFRLITGDAEGGAGKAASKIISSGAIRAVQEADQGSTDGKNRSALGTYMKLQAMQFLLLGIVLVYLIQGQLWVAVGWILDAAGGFLGF